MWEPGRAMTFWLLLFFTATTKLFHQTNGGTYFVQNTVTFLPLLWLMRTPRQNLMFIKHLGSSWDVVKASAILKGTPGNHNGEQKRAEVSNFPVRALLTAPVPPTFAQRKPRQGWRPQAGPREHRPALSATSLFSFRLP